VIVVQDSFPTLTAKVARDLVVFLRRHGGHDQTSIHLSFREHLHPGVHRIQDWLSTHFAEPVPLARLAKLANMSSRNLVRVFKTATGLTPLQYQQRLRLEFARSLLRDSQLTLESIAESSGFADARHFRRLWKSTFHAPTVGVAEGASADLSAEAPLQRPAAKAL